MFSRIFSNASSSAQPGTTRPGTIRVVVRAARARGGITPRLTVTGLVALAGLAWASPVRAQAALEFGPFRLVPSLQVREEYDDNVTLSPSNTASDYLTYIMPGLALKLRGATYGANLAYRAEILRYVNQTHLDTVRHSVQADGRVDVGTQLTLTMADELKRTDDFVGGPVPEQTQRVAHYENTLELGGEYRLADRYSIGLDYRFFLISYQEGGPTFTDLDRKDHTIALSLYYQLFPKTSVFVQYAYALVRYDKADASATRDSDAHEGFVGIRGDLTAKTSATVKVGGGIKDFADGSSSTDVLVEGDITYKYREPSAIRLFVARSNTESTFTQNNTIDKFYVATYGGVDVTHQLSPRFGIKLVGLVGTNDYPDVTTVGTKTAKRSDVVYTVGAAIHYDFQRWLAVELAYDRRVRDSNFSDFNYTDNRVRASLVLTF